ncbi:MAG: DEAD/DEAH box helicase family protein [Clostridium sp.]|nr:DEAD/DEAH box helicase family protein [Clostridium sp.]
MISLIYHATGIGKTYLVAFDSREFGSVLFIAHREEILNQAARTFSNVRGSKEIGFYNQKNKDSKKKILFASVQTLSRREYLKLFRPDQFEYIVINEFHHASSVSYRRIVEYFKPKFLLGLTATPHRLDKKDVFQICDYNVPYEVSLFNAINRDWLVPFQYYGIYDGTVKYENITYL